MDYATNRTIIARLDQMLHTHFISPLDATIRSTRLHKFFLTDDSLSTKYPLSAEQLLDCWRYEVSIKMKQPLDEDKDAESYTLLLGIVWDFDLNYSHYTDPPSDKWQISCDAHIRYEADDQYLPGSYHVLAPLEMNYADPADLENKLQTIEGYVKATSPLLLDLFVFEMNTYFLPEL
jgi:hypothetical protein